LINTPGFLQSQSKIDGFLWIGLDWIGLDWIGLDWIGLDWMHRAATDGTAPHRALVQQGNESLLLFSLMFIIIIDELAQSCKQAILHCCNHV
jgi:hypothetical protein